MYWGNDSISLDRAGRELDSSLNVMEMDLAPTVVNL